MEDIFGRTVQPLRWALLYGWDVDELDGLDGDLSDA